MSIVGQNTVLNQYVPTFYIKNLMNGQQLAYNSVLKAFTNVNPLPFSGNNLHAISEIIVTPGTGYTAGDVLTVIGGTYTSPAQIVVDTIDGSGNILIAHLAVGGQYTILPTNAVAVSGGTGTGATFNLTWSIVTMLNQLTDVSPNVDNAANGQALVFNTTSGLWQNQFIDYNTLLNKPAIGSSTFVGLTDVSPTPIPNGYVLWNNTGTQLIYSTTIPGSNVIGLATVAHTGLYSDLIGAPTLNSGTVTDVSIVTANGISGTVSTPTTTPAITLSLGDITPNSVTAAGTLSGLNFSGTSSGTNTGDQIIALSGDATGSGIGPITVTLSNTGVVAGSYSNPTLVIDSKGRVVSATAGTSGVTSVAATATTGIIVTGSPITSSGTLTFSLGNITPTGVASTGTVTGTNLSGTNTGDQTIALSGDVTGSGIGPITATLAPTGVTAGTYGSVSLIPQFTVDSKGRITHVTNIVLPDDGDGTVTSFSATGADGVTTLVIDSTTTPQLTIGLGDITPISVNATGSITGLNLAGVNTGDQQIAMTGDVTAPITYGMINATLAPSGVSAGTYSSPTLTVDAKGRVTSITSNTSVTSFTGAGPARTGAVTLTAADISAALGYVPGLGSVSSVGLVSPLSTLSISNSPIILSGNLQVDLPTTGVSAGSYFGANITIDAYGRITAASNGTVGTVTSVAAIGQNGINVISGSPVTTMGTITLGLGNITPTGVAATGPITGTNLSGTNTGDQTISLSGDATGSGIGPITVTLATINATPVANSLVKISVNGKGLITATSAATASDIEAALGFVPYNATNPAGYISVVTEAEIVTALGYTPYSTANPAGYLTENGLITVTGDATGSGTELLPITLNTVNTSPIDPIILGPITPGSGYSPSLGSETYLTVPLTGGTGSGAFADITVTNGEVSSLVLITPGSGYHLGDVLTASATNIGGTGSGFSVLIAQGTYGDSGDIPVITVNSKGLVTSISTTSLDPTVSDYITATETLVIGVHRQYIVTGQLTVLGNIINNGRIAIL